jgi:hypothetical protein
MKLNDKIICYDLNNQEEPIKEFRILEQDQFVSQIIKRRNFSSYIDLPNNRIICVGGEFPYHVEELNAKYEVFDNMMFIIELDFQIL